VYFALKEMRNYVNQAVEKCQNEFTFVFQNLTSYSKVQTQWTEEVLTMPLVTMITLLQSFFNHHRKLQEEMQF